MMQSVGRVGLLGLLLGGLLIVGWVSGAEEAIGVAVRPTKLWRFLDEDDRILVQRFKEGLDEFSVGDVRCLRYCIESRTTMDEMPSVLNLIWKLDNNNNNRSGPGSASAFDKDLKPEVIQGESTRAGNTRGSRCTFSIVIGCELSKGIASNLGAVEKRFIASLQPNVDITEDSGDKSSLNFLRERLADEANLTSETEHEFRVQPNQAEVSVVVFGNVSRIDLKMPIAPSRTSPTEHESAVGAAPRLTLATTRMPAGVSGVRLNVVNPPPGGWRLRIQGLDGQMYRLVIVQAVVPEFNDLGAESSPFKNTNAQNLSKTSVISSRQIKVLGDIDGVDETRMSDNSESKHTLLPRSKIPSASEQKEPKSFKFPASENKAVSFNLNNDDGNITTRMDFDDDDGVESRVIDRQFVDLADLSNPLNEELPMRKYLTVELSPTSELIANPGSSYHRLTFDVTNSHVLRIRHYLFPSSQPFLIHGLPRFVDIAPGQTVSVPVDIAIPPNAGEIVNKVSLRVEGIEIVEKSANFYVRTASSRVNDDRRPEIDYYFNGQCHGRSTGERCLKSYWSVDIVVQDYDSGLKSVTSLPKGMYARTPYISGTSSPVKLYYANNCCNRFVEITAMDASGNVYSRKIDVDEWTNLTTGDILAIIFIILFVILLVILIVILIVYCIKRRRSHDLPYSQRYGSRSSPQ